MMSERPAWMNKYIEYGEQPVAYRLEGQFGDPRNNDPKPMGEPRMTFDEAVLIARKHWHEHLKQSSWLYFRGDYDYWLAGGRLPWGYHATYHIIPIYKEETPDDPMP
jgi:hypothetical protein